MATPLVDRISLKLEQARTQYHQLVIVVAPAGSGKTAAFRELQQRTGASLLNVNQELSRQMLELTVRQRAIQAPQLLTDMVRRTRGHVILLDNIEILFDTALKQDPLRLLQKLSRNKTVAAAWNGRLDGNHLNYAEPGHPEYGRYAAEDIATICPVTG